MNTKACGTFLGFFESFTNHELCNPLNLMAIPPRLERGTYCLEGLSRPFRNAISFDLHSYIIQLTRGPYSETPNLQGLFWDQEVHQ